MERYVKCECGNVVRYRGHISKAGRCPRCERWLWEGEPVTIGVWLEAHDIKVLRRKAKTLTGDILCQD